MLLPQCNHKSLQLSVSYVKSKTPTQWCCKPWPFPQSIQERFKPLSVQEGVGDWGLTYPFCPKYRYIMACPMACTARAATESTPAQSTPQLYCPSSLSSMIPPVWGALQEKKASSKSFKHRTGKGVISGGVYLPSSFTLITLSNSELL